MNRSLGVVITLVWLAAMTALVRRDVLPYWTAKDAPNQLTRDGKYQCGIANSAGKRIGTTFVTTTPGPQLTTVHSSTDLDLSALASYLPTQKQLLIDTDLTYEPDGRLFRFAFYLHGAAVPISVIGERIGHDYVCTATIGGTTTVIPLDWRVSEGLGEMLRPFTHLEGLHVGQRWRLRLLDPLAVLKGGDIEFKNQLVTVTGRETIESRGEPVECFRIETEGTIAWADDSGRVVRQEVLIPLLGKWVLTDEVFDQELYRAATATGRSQEPPSKDEQSVKDHR